MNFEAMAWAARQPLPSDYDRLVLLTLAAQANERFEYCGLKRTIDGLDRTCRLPLCDTVQRLYDRGLVELVGMRDDCEAVWRLPVLRVEAARP